MIRTYLAELTLLSRRRLLLTTVTVCLVAAGGGATLILSTAAPAGALGAVAGRLPTVESLAAAGGGSQVFRTIASFAGTLVFVVVVGVVAADFSRGTIRTMLVRQPNRLGLLVGKIAALCTFGGACLLLTEAATWLVAWLQAPLADVDTSAWTTLDGLVAAVTDYGVVLAWFAGYAILGASLGVLLRSVPLALGIGLAWAGPIEHIVQGSWATASRVFPGLLLEAFAAGGTPEVSATRALLTVTGYVAVAALATGIAFTRRDVTA